jgi:hypothetical protein
VRFDCLLSSAEKAVVTAQGAAASDDCLTRTDVT